jgi:hypothetical protein
MKKIAKLNHGNLRFLSSKISKWEVKINWKMTLPFQDTVPMGRLTVVNVVSRRIPPEICITIWKKSTFMRPMQIFDDTSFVRAWGKWRNLISRDVCPDSPNKLSNLLNVGVEKYLLEIKNFKYCQAVTKLRVSAHRLPIEIGRYKNCLLW